MTRRYSMRLDLIDEQLLDSDDLPFGRVEDVELTFHDGEPPTIDVVLTGQEAFGQRIGGITGGLLANMADRLRDREHERGPVAIECAAIQHVDEHVHVNRRLEELRHVAGLEHWLAQHVVEAIPGSGDEGD